jgi:glycosyltransferase involved in cell wall biosynthesis
MLGHQEKAHGIYREVDVFILPSLIGSDPLVTHEAMGHGLPSLVSPTGAGVGLRDGIEGFVLEPHDARGWVEAIRNLAEREDLRKRLGAAARERAMLFTWDKVAEQRYCGLIQRLQNGAD